MCSYRTHHARHSMENKDSIHLLKECDAGTKMGIKSIDDVIDNVKNHKMKSLLIESKGHHEKLREEIHKLMEQYHSTEKDPNPMATFMSWVKTNGKMMMNNDDRTIADLITSGCDMGVKSLNKYLNQYPTANHQVKDICNRLISIEEALRDDLTEFL